LPVVTIPNGIDSRGFAEALPIDWTAWGLDHEGPLLLFLGRLHRQKGLDLLIDVAPTLWQLHPQLRLAIVGEGPMERQVRRLVAQAPRGRAALLPWQAHVASLYAGADIVILPSRYEGMPNVILEAMAAGRCVIAADVEGVSELLGPLAPEQTFPPGDRGSMVQRLDQRLRDEQHDALAQANRQRAAEMFSVEAMISRYQRFYLQLLDRDS
jgi:starch synthase (maltosyl-transferring)